MNFRTVFDLIRESIIGWSRADASLHAAALAFYTIFSLAPLVIITAGIAGLIFSQAVVQGSLILRIEQLIGAEAAAIIADIFANIPTLFRPDLIPSWIATLIGLGILLWAASIVFVRLQGSLNAMWGIVPISSNVQQNVVGVVKTRLLSTVAALAVGVIFLTSLLFNTIWTAVPTQIIVDFIPGFDLIAPLISLILFPALYTVIFAAIFKYLPQAKARWRDIWPGATITAVLFWIGSFLIGFFLGRSWLVSIYGAAGSLIIFLIWVYYSAWIILFGAKFIQVYSRRFGTPIVPDEGSMFRPHPGPKNVIQLEHQG